MESWLKDRDEFNNVSNNSHQNHKMHASILLEMLSRRNKYSFHDLFVSTKIYALKKHPKFMTPPQRRRGSEIKISSSPPRLRTGAIYANYSRYGPPSAEGRSPGASFQKEPKGAKREPKGAKREPKGSLTSQKGAKRASNGDQNPPTFGSAC